MAILRIGKATVSRLKSGDRAYIAYDATLKGFGVRVMPTGHMSYVVEYRPGAGGRAVPKRRITIGRVGVLTPEQSRRAAKKLLADVQGGADPAATRRRDRAIPTFGTFAASMLDEADDLAKARPQEARLRLGSIRNYRSLLKQHLHRSIGRTKLDILSTAELTHLHKTIGMEKPVTANRCLEFIGSVFKEAVRRGVMPFGSNPARGIAAFKERKRERYLSDAELMRLGIAIREAETVGIPWRIDETNISKHVPKSERTTRIDQNAAAALKLLLLTGARLREILHSKWSDVDLQRGVLFVEGKTGRRAVILSATAAAILAETPRRGTFVFPGERSTSEAPTPRSDLNRPWRAIARHAELDGVRLHDLRHSFASFAAAGGASLPIIGRLLGHTQPQTTARYSHLADDPLRAVADRVGEHVGAALSAIPLHARSPS